MAKKIRQVIKAQDIDAFVLPTAVGGGRRPTCAYKGCRKGRTVLMKFSSRGSTRQETVALCTEHLAHEGNRLLDHYKFHQ